MANNQEAESHGLDGRIYISQLLQSRDLLAQSISRARLGETHSQTQFIDYVVLKIYPRLAWLVGRFDLKVVQCRSCQPCRCSRISAFDFSTSVISVLSYSSMM